MSSFAEAGEMTVGPGLLFAAAAATLLTLSAAGVAAPKPGSAPPALSAEDRQAIDEASRRGALLYAYDQAAWHGTDEMVAKLPDFRSKVGGWIVDGPANAPELVFFDRDPAAPHAVFIADFKDGKLASSHAAGPGEAELSPERRRLIAARAAALQALLAKGITRCVDAPMNTVVLPPLGESGTTSVYVLTPQTKATVIPFGGHYRIDVGGDGRAANIRPFTNSCIALPVAEAGKPRSVALYITHLLDPVPTEIHVFSSLVARVPVVVGTKDGRIWEVNGATITAVDRIQR
jgi:hypothetical protein